MPLSYPPKDATVHPAGKVKVRAPGRAIVSARPARIGIGGVRSGGDIFARICRVIQLVWVVSRRRRKTDALPLPALLALGVLGVVLLNPRWFGPFLIIGLLAAGLFIWYKVNAAQRKRQAALKLRDLQALSPRELELHVATVVASLPGWKAEATRSSLDQGADVIATSSAGVKIAV